MAVNKNKKTEVKRLPELEYVMPRGMFDNLVANRADKNSNPYEYAMQYVNDTYGLLGTVTTLRVEG